MSNFRGGSNEYTQAYVQASIEASVTEGGDDKGRRTEAKGKAFPTQGSVIFHFRFPDELRYNESYKQCNCFDSHQIWNKTPDSKVSKGERTQWGVKTSDITKIIVIIMNPITR